MNKENLKNSVKEFLSKGEVQKAIAILLVWSEKNFEELYNKIILLSGRFNKLKEKRLLGLERPEDLDRELNRINFAVIEFLNDIPEQVSKDFGGIFIAEKEEEKPKDKSSFSYWLEHKNTRIGSLFAFIGGIGLILGISAIAIALFEYDALQGEKENFNMIALVAVIANIVVAGLAVKYISKAKMNEELKKRFEGLLNGDNSDSLATYYNRAESATKEFIKFWRLVWIGWIVLYISFFFKFFHEKLNVFGISAFLKDNIFTDENEFLIQVWIDTWSNVSSFGLIVCFSILYFKNRSRKDKHYDNPITTYSFYLFAGILLIQIIILLSMNVSVSQTIQGLFKILVGLGSAISISLLAGRLDSKLINASIAFIIITYVYAGIQSLISFFEPSFFTTEYAGLSHFARAFALNYALFAKCVLFLFILWLINEGKLLLYIIRLNAIIDENESKE